MTEPQDLRTERPPDWYTHLVGRVEEVRQEVAENRRDIKVLGEKLEARFRDQDEKFDARFRDQDEKFDARFRDQDEKIEARFRDQDEKIETRFREQDAKIEARFREQAEKIEARFRESDKTQQDTQVAVAALGGRVEELRRMVVGALVVVGGGIALLVVGAIARPLLERFVAALFGG